MGAFAEIFGIGFFDHSEELFDLSGNAAKHCKNVPQAPSNLIATAQSDTQISFIWQDKSDNEDGFKIYRREGAGGWQKIDTVGASREDYLDVGSDCEKTYYCCVRAYNISDDPDYSNKIVLQQYYSTTTDICPGPACTPGQTQTTNCNDCGQKTRTCQSNGQWGNRGSCVGTRTCPGEESCDAKGWCVCPEYGGGFIGYFSDCNNPNGIEFGLLDKQHSQTWNLHVDDHLGCDVMPKFVVSNFSGDIEIGAWYVCDNSLVAELDKCVSGTLVYSGFDLFI